MAFTDMNDIENELGEEKPPERNGNRTFLIIAGILGGIMVLALLCIAGLALYRYLPSQQAAQHEIATQAAQDTAAVLASTQTVAIPTATATKTSTSTPTNTPRPTNTPVVVIVPTKSPTVELAVATRNYFLTQTAVKATGTITMAAPATTAPVKATSTSVLATTSPVGATTSPVNATSTSVLAPTSLVKATSTSVVSSPAPGITTATPPPPLPRPTVTALPGTGIADELGTPGLLAAGFALIMVIFVVRRLRSAL